MCAVVIATANSPQILLFLSRIDCNFIHFWPWKWKIYSLNLRFTTFLFGCNSRCGERVNIASASPSTLAATDETASSVAVRQHTPASRYNWIRRQTDRPGNRPKPLAQITREPATWSVRCRRAVLDPIRPRSFAACPKTTFFTISRCFTGGESNDKRSNCWLDKKFKLLR